MSKFNDYSGIYEGNEKDKKPKEKEMEKCKEPKDFKKDGINQTQIVNVNVPFKKGKQIDSAGLLVDFAFFRTFVPENTLEISTDVNDPTQVAQVTLNDLEAGDIVWLNGLFHPDNDNVETANLRVSILKNGHVIYNQQLVEIDEDGHDDSTTLPVQTVDVQGSDGNVTYTLVVLSNLPNVFINFEVTFTAAVIRR